MAKSQNINNIQMNTRNIITWGDGRKTVLRVLQGTEFVEVTWLTINGKRKGQTLGFENIKDVQKWFKNNFIDTPNRLELLALSIDLKEVK